jgi:hypothetical protein
MHTIFLKNQEWQILDCDFKTGEWCGAWISNATLTTEQVDWCQNHISKPPIIEVDRDFGPCGMMLFGGNFIPEFGVNLHFTTDADLLAFKLKYL